MLADKSASNAVIDHFLHAFGYFSIPVNMAVPGDEGAPIVAIEGPIGATGTAFIQMVEQAKAGTTGQSPDTKTAALDEPERRVEIADRE